MSEANRYSHNPNNLRLLTFDESEQALIAIKAASGNIPSAAEALRTTPANLLAVIASDKQAVEELNVYLRGILTVNLFDLFSVLNSSLIESINSERIEAKDVAKTLTGVVEMITKLTDNHHSTQDINVYDTLRKQLPPHIRKAVDKAIEGEDDDA